MRHCDRMLVKFDLLWMLLVPFFAACNLDTFQTGPRAINSPLEARTLRLLNELWQPGCFKVYVVRAEFAEFPDLSIYSSRVFVREQFAEAFNNGDVLLRAVLAHEVGHAILHHDDKRTAAYEDLMEAMISLITRLERSVMFHDVKFLVEAYPAFVTQLRQYVTLINEQEIEADEAALRILRSRGFDPEAYILALESLPKHLVEADRQASTTIVQMFKDLTDGMRAIAPELSVGSPLPPFITVKDRADVAQRRMGAIRGSNTLNVTSCPKSLADEELVNLFDRNTKRQEELNVKVKNVQDNMNRVMLRGRPAAQVVPENSTQESVQIKLDLLKAEKPQWKPGYEWKYQWKSPGSDGILTREVLREEVLGGVSTYVVRVGKNENFYAKDVLGLLATTSGGRMIVNRDTPYQPFSWPLEIGKEWRNSFTLERPGQKSSQKYDNRVVVSGIETVQVPAGSFETYKIEVYGAVSGKLLTEYWYSPQVKWFVRSRAYEQNGVRQEELITYKIY